MGLKLKRWIYDVFLKGNYKMPTKIYVDVVSMLESGKMVRRRPVTMGYFFSPERVYSRYDMVGEWECMRRLVNETDFNDILETIAKKELSVLRGKGYIVNVFDVWVKGMHIVQCVYEPMKLDSRDLTYKEYQKFKRWKKGKR